MSTSLLNRRLGSKAQLRMFETIGVLLVFAIIVALGIQFYFRIQQSSFEDSRLRFEQLDSISISSTILHMPELLCSLRNVVEGACFDSTKMDAFVAEEPNLRDIYITFLGESTVYVDYILPDYPDVVLYNQTPGIDFITSRTPHPITVFNSSSQNYAFAVLWVEVHSPLQ